MGKITSALKKAAEERLTRIDKISRIKENRQFIVKKVQDSKIDSRIVCYFDPKSLVSEQYKIFRTNILSLNKGNPPHTIAITSSVHSEGKSITSLNLSFVMAQSVHKPKVLLIDADLRRGSIAKYLGVEQKAGLAEVLSAKASVEDTLFKVDLENLTFLACGAVPENPAELLDSPEMKNFLREMKKKFDYIIIDTPPIINVTDAGILSAEVDGVIMVIQAGRTQRGIVERATELLHQAHAKLLGHILTNIEYHLPEYIYRYL